MSWASTGPALVELLAPLQDAGEVHLGERHIRDMSRLRQLCLAEQDGAELERLRVWFVGRDSVRESWSTQTRTRATETYSLRLVEAVRSSDSAERDIQALLDRVRDALRADTSIGSAHISRPAKWRLSPAEFGGVGCWSGVVTVDVEEVYTIDTTVIQPVLSATAGAGRAGQADIADQIARYVAIGAPGWRVWAHRPWATTEAERAERFEVDSVTDPGQRRVQAWRVYRESDEEQRGLGSLVSGTPGWRVDGALAWHDAGDSYDEFQNAIDALRVTFRGVGNLGNPSNPSASLSSPLQVTVGTKTIMGVLCHSAECRLDITEVV